MGNLLNFGCELMNKIKPGFNCDKFYLEQKHIGEGFGSTVEAALIEQFWTDGIGVIVDQYEKRPVYSATMRLTPVLNYVETWRNSMFAKGIEGLSGRQLFQNYLQDPNPEQKTEEIKNDIKVASPDSTQAVDSIQIDWK